ncbi:MAG: DJ-1 family glyoxalase III [Fidelibacterota bacterium]
MTKILVPLAEGLEEIEAISIIDILRRGGAEVTTAGLDALEIRGSHNIVIKADEILANLEHDNFDGVVLPGGMPGTLNLKNDTRLKTMIQKMNDAGKLVAAICAAPMVLFEAGVLKYKKFTIHPGEKDKVKYIPENQQVVEDGNLVTGQASGAAVLFALTLVKKLFGKEKMDAVNKGVLYKL